VTEKPLSNQYYGLSFKNKARVLKGKEGRGMMNSGILILITFWLCLATAQDPSEQRRLVEVQAITGDDLFMNSQLLDSPEYALAMLKRDQAEEVAKGHTVRTLIITDNSRLILPQTNNPYLQGNTYTILVDDGKTSNERHFEMARNKSILFSKMRSLGSLVMYTLIFPKNEMWQSLAIVGLQAASNYIYREPERWNNFQQGFQSGVFRSKTTEFLMKSGVPRSAIEFTTRVMFNLGHGAVWAVPAIVVLGVGNFDIKQYLDTLVYSFLASASWDETLNKYGNKKGMELLTKNEYVTANAIRTLTFMVLTPLVQRGFILPHKIGIALFVAGAASYWLPQGILKIRDFVEGVEELHFRRTHSSGICSLSLNR
jgi:hypothetical protein